MEANFPIGGLWSNCAWTCTGLRPEAISKANISSTSWRDYYLCPRAAARWSCVSLSKWVEWGASVHYPLWQNWAPLCITHYDKTDALSMWDGCWVGPDLQLDFDWNTGDKNWLRTGWRFLPSPEMNCRIETFSAEDLLSIPPAGLDGKEKSIMVIGTSVMRGVFLSMADLLLPFGDKRYFAPSVIGKCWGRAHVKKGNLRLMY